MSPDQLAQAVCKDAPPDMFYPDSSKLKGPGSADRAVAVWRKLAAPALELCDVCPVREPCLVEALTFRDLDGVRGGRVPPELHEMAGPAQSPHGSRSKYVYGCRCVACTAANAAYRRTRRAS